MVGKIKILENGRVTETFNYTEELEKLFLEKKEYMQAFGKKVIIDKPKPQVESPGLHKVIIVKTGKWKIGRGRDNMLEVKWIGVVRAENENSLIHWSAIDSEDVIWLKFRKATWKQFLLDSIPHGNGIIPATLISQRQILDDEIPTRYKDGFWLIGRRMSFFGSWRSKWCHNPREAKLITEGD